MTTLFTIPTQPYPDGAQQVPAQSVAQDATQILVTLDVSAMTNPAQSYDASFDISYDGGTNWGFLIGVHRDGGIIHDRLGNPITTATFGVGLADPTSTTRQIRGTVTIAGGPITLGGTVAVT